MALILGRSIQRVLLTVTACLLLITIVTVHYHKPEYSEIIGNHVSYYHGKVKDYASDRLAGVISSGSTENTDASSSADDESVQRKLEIIKILDQPALKAAEPQMEDPEGTFEISRAEFIADRHKEYKQLFKKLITEPKDVQLSKISPNSEEETPQTDYLLANATFVSLVRNSELRQVVSTIKQIESTFNDKYHYPYVFLNDETFTDRFKDTILKLVPHSTVEFGVIDRNDWVKPSSVDTEKEAAGLKALEDAGVGYASMTSYHNMCRYYSMGFYHHELMQKYRYYWRVEPGVKYYCDIEYDMFKFMEDNGKVYGFVIALYDSPDSVKTLWPTTLDFLRKNPQHLHENSANAWLRENLQNPSNYATANGYSTCHFWSNFEIADMDFYRAEAYSSWMKHLEESGGFYYERWGDAPVHSVGVGLFADKKDIHWFRDVGYFHPPYYNAPDREPGKCNNRMPAPGTFSTGGLEDQDCLVNWVNMAMENDHY